MKYDCHIIQDLIPLAIDGIASTESTRAVDEHINECASCRQYYTTSQQEPDLHAPPLSSEEQAETTKVLFYKKRIKKYIRRSLMILAIVPICIGLLFFFVVTRLTFWAPRYTTSDSSEYLANKAEIAHPTSQITFPTVIKDNYTINNYYYKWQSVGFNDSYQLVLDYSMSSADFNAEVERLSHIYTEKTLHPNHLIYDTENFVYPAYVAVFGNSEKNAEYEYALIDEENCRIICILSTTGLPLKNLPIDKACLPLNINAYDDWETEYGYSFYRHNSAASQ